MNSSTPFFSSLHNIMDTISRSNDVLYRISSYKQRNWKVYVYGLRYNEIKKLKITEEHIYSQFRVSQKNDIQENKEPNPI